MPGVKPVVPVTPPAVLVGHRTPDHTAKMLCFVPAWFWPEPQLEPDGQKNQGAIAINLGTPNPPAGTILTHEKIVLILIVCIYNINLTYGHTHVLFHKENSKSGIEPRLDTN